MHARVDAAWETLKAENASLFVQNQGSALQTQGTASDPVTFTSYNDAGVGGATNGNPDTTPNAGDWGGIVFRNYDETIAGQELTNFPVDGTLVATFYRPSEGEVASGQVGDELRAFGAPGPDGAAARR